MAADAPLPSDRWLVGLGADGELIQTDDPQVRLLSGLKEDEAKQKEPPPGEQSRATPHQWIGERERRPPDRALFQRTLVTPERIWHRG
jgi:hypothetical protein